MLGIALSTIAFFVAGYFIKRYLDDIGIPKTMVRGMVVFVLALAVAYGVAFVVDWFAGPSGSS
jgi:membrane protein DedA with SNARE-associated domain